MDHRRRLIGRTAVAALVSTALIGALSLGYNPPLQAQLTGSGWEAAAGGKMSFDVASVKRSEPGKNYHMNFPLTLGASNFASVGNLMSVDVPLRMLMGFAFKLSTGQMHFLVSGLPDWVDSETFDIEARAPIAHPSKDQFRLMVQSLLVDRFKLSMHIEKREVPIYALVLTKPGTTGPQLRPHIDDKECGGEGRPAAPPVNAELEPFPCGATLMGAESKNPGQARGGGRNVSLDYIAAFLTGTGFQGAAPDRPVVNRTGLTGNYDFWIDFVPDANGGGPAAAPADSNGPTMTEALRDQLGLKLNATTGTVDVLVVDHIEPPAEN